MLHFCIWDLPAIFYRIGGRISFQWAIRDFLLVVTLNLILSYLVRFVCYLGCVRQSGLHKAISVAKIPA